VSTPRVAERLKRYGVPEKNIVLTGFPLPKELREKAKQDLKRRLRVLDPKGVYRKRYGKLISQYVGSVPVTGAKPRPVTVAFAIGGAGAQAEIAGQAAESLKPLMRAKKLQLTVIAGVHKSIADSLDKTVRVVSATDKKTYFRKFNEVLRETDILWTKPSELSFYTALGIPVLIAPPVGSQEIANRGWLREMGSGVDQMSPKLAHQWLPDFIGKGLFAEAAMQGFVEGERKGVENVTKLVCG
jgi:UDP-N-acetylglucosamine:LPS N-acetylglucosamine transferase